MQKQFIRDKDAEAIHQSFQDTRNKKEAVFADGLFLFNL